MWKWLKPFLIHQGPGTIFFLLGAFMSIAMERLMELVLSGQFCDITVVCRGNDGSQGLPMSRLVLAAVCPAVKVTNAQVELQVR